MTFEEHRGPIEGKTVAWAGDGNNVLAFLGRRRRALRLPDEHGRAAGLASRTTRI